MNRTIDLYSGNTGTLIREIKIPEITAIPAVVAFHPSLNLLAAANASGRASLWEGRQS
jgi:hypothetical protein